MERHVTDSHSMAHDVTIDCVTIEAIDMDQQAIRPIRPFRLIPP